MSAEQMISQYGYLALFAGVAVEGEATLIAASLAAHQGYLDLPWVVVVAFVATMMADQFYFFLGRLKGKRYLKGRPVWQSRVGKVQSLLERHHRLVILAFRFFYGLRSVAPFAIGMSEVKTSTFVSLNAMGAFAWAFLIGCFGFLFGTVLESLIVGFKHHERTVLLLVLVVGAIVWAAWHVRDIRLMRQARKRT
jgi:membrane protein DedA with SNARE-associated domain